MPLPSPDHSPAAIARLRGFATDLARIWKQPVLLIMPGSGQGIKREWWQFSAAYLKLQSEADQHEQECACEVIYPPETPSQQQTGV